MKFTQNHTALQKDSFYNAKGLVLERKRSPFGMQKDSFWRMSEIKLSTNPFTAGRGAVCIPLTAVRATGTVWCRCCPL